LLKEHSRGQLVGKAVWLKAQAKRKLRRRGCAYISDRRKMVTIAMRDGFAGRAEFTSTGNIDQGYIVYYKASKNGCSICALKPQCTTSVARKVARDVNEGVRDRIRALASTEAFQQSRRGRKKLEMRFARMKRILKLDRFRLRGLSGARDEVLLTATTQNLRRLAKPVFWVHARDHAADQAGARR